MKKIFSVIILFLVYATTLFADVEFVADAPQRVIAGKQFRVTFTVNQDGKNFLAPDMSDFDVLYGPSRSVSSSTSIINGNVTSSKTISYTYILSASKVGTFVLQPASITIRDEKYSTNKLTIEVIENENNSAGQQTAQGGGAGQQVVSSTGPESGNVFIRPIVSKSKVYEQEALLVSYKLYFRGVELRDIPSAKLPEFAGFFVQEIEQKGDLQILPENYNGLNYSTITIKQYLLFPQQSGELNTEAGSIDLVMLVSTGKRNQTFFDSFFNSYQEVRKTVAIPSAKITVKPLPKPAPSGFDGAVGDFKLNSSISTNELNANDAVTLKLSISGTGNLKLIKTPKVQFPNDFDAYDPKVENNFKPSLSGVSGSKDFEYLAIPRFGGDFEIPAVKFVYFDVHEGNYKTLSTPNYELKVEGSTSETAVSTPTYNAANKEDIKNLGSDIRHIHNSSLLSKKNDFFFGTMLYWALQVVPLLIFIALLIILRKRAREYADVSARKTKRANKLARKRLKSAEKYMKAGDKPHFYEETIKALWGYLGDKLLIPVASLTKDNVQMCLSEHNVSKELTDNFLNTLSDCEFARYSPIEDENLSMDKIYERAINLISELDDNIKA